MSGSTPGFIPGQKPTADQWNGYFAVKTDGANFGNVPFVVSSGLTARTLQQRANIINVLDYLPLGQPNGTTDNTAGLQAALSAAAGGICFMPPGRYFITGTLLISSNTTWIGCGLATEIFVTNPTPFNMINNANFTVTFNATTKADYNINISGIYFNYGTTNGGHAHAIAIRMAQNVTVRDCFFSGGNDFTAMLACTTTLVENCHMAPGGVALTNCAFDHWDGAQDMTVRKCSATMAGGNGLLCTGVDTTGVLARASGNGLFEDNQITGGGVGCYMNAGYTGCSVSNMTVRGNRFIGTAGGIVMDGPGGQHIIDGNWWINGGSSGSGDCAIRIAAGTNPATASPNDCIINNTQIINSTTANVNAGMIQLQGLRHKVGAVSCIGAAISGGTLFYFPTNSNGSVVVGPVTADAPSISNISFGLYQDSAGAFGSNTALSTWDPFNGFFRHEGPAEDHYYNPVTIHRNQNLLFLNQTSAPGSGAGTLTNAPAAGNPAFWLPITVNGATRRIPVW